MKTSKGITLVALVITIIILIILAGVSNSLVMGDNGIATKARQGATNYQNAAKEEMSLINTLLDNVGYDETPGGGSGNPPTTYAAYSIGQEVTVGGESFYVLENSGASQSTVTLLAKYNLSNTANELGHYMQLENASYEDTKSTFSNSNYWVSDWISGTKLDLNNYSVPVTENIESSAILKAQDYASAVGATDGRLLTFEEADTLKTSYGNMIWGNANRQGEGSSNYYLFYWLGSSNDSNNNGVLMVEGSAEGTDWGFCDVGSYNGVRPVITVSKNNVILVQNEEERTILPD